MIEFKKVRIDERAADQIYRDMRLAGYKGEEAQRLADEASAITIATIRSLDDKIMAAASEDLDRTVIQQVVMHQLIGTCQKGLELNVMKMLIDMMGGKP